MAVIRAETEAWLQRDFEALASHWVQSPQTRRMEYFASLGVRVDEGWDPIAARIRKIVERFPEKYAFSERVRWEKVNIVVDGNMGHLRKNDPDAQASGQIPTLPGGIHLHRQSRRPSMLA